MDGLSAGEFFEPPPAPPPEPEPAAYRLPPWIAAPVGTLPGVVALDRVLARTDDVAVCVGRIAAYPAGFEFDLVTLTRPGRPSADPLLFEHHRLRRGGSAGAGLLDEFLRFGVQFADGTKVTNTGAPGFAGDGAEPAGPVMTTGGGGGGGGTHRQSMWVWPLPPAGPLEFVCEWPAHGIPVTRTAIDAAAILEAAGRARVVFSDEHLPLPGDQGRW